jgi:hypothetical protein
MAHYIHHVPGRLRVRLPQLKRNPAYAADLRVGLQRRDGILSVECNAITGSLLVIYDPRTISLGSLQEAIPEIPIAKPVCPVCSSPRSASSEIVEGIGDKLVSMAMEKAMAHSARVLLGALF